MAGEATFRYDVYLSFRGADTRMGFASHLYDALCQRGIRTFLDNTKIGKGDEIWPTISKAIEESRSAIILFSQNYASSSWCLEELAIILDGFKEKKLRHVFPVFYDVSPSDVRRQRGSYGEAFARHEKTFKDDQEKLNRWRMALHHAANLAGFVSTTYPNFCPILFSFLKFKEDLNSFCNNGFFKYIV
ncbi:TMV resistance protein N [Spatholobus suberectus]|nr:TMV resistance protein N [Spatholobus suberectus]